MNMSTCHACHKSLKARQKKFCSNKCQGKYVYISYIAAWKQNLKTGSRGKSTFNLSAHVIRYVKEKYNFSCARCGWNKVNTHLGTSPLEIDHIDGNADNNSENNLILLCPNCHSLKKTYKNLNKGHGRLWKRKKYVKINSVAPL